MIRSFKLFNTCFSQYAADVSVEQPRKSSLVYCLADSPEESKISQSYVLIYLGCVFLVSTETGETKLFLFMNEVEIVVDNIVNSLHCIYTTIRV